MTDKAPRRPFNPETDLSVLGPNRSKGVHADRMARELAEQLARQADAGDSSAARDTAAILNRANESTVAMASDGTYHLVEDIEEYEAFQRLARRLATGDGY